MAEGNSWKKEVRTWRDERTPEKDHTTNVEREDFYRKFAEKRAGLQEEIWGQNEAEVAAQFEAAGLNTLEALNGKDLEARRIRSGETLYKILEPYFKEVFGLSGDALKKEILSSFPYMMSQDETDGKKFNIDHLEVGGSVAIRNGFLYLWTAGGRLYADGIRIKPGKTEIAKPEAPVAPVSTEVLQEALEEAEPGTIEQFNAKAALIASKFDWVGEISWFDNSNFPFKAEYLEYLDHFEKALELAKRFHFDEIALLRQVNFKLTVPEDDYDDWDKPFAAALPGQWGVMSLGKTEQETLQNLSNTFQQMLVMRDALPGEGFTIMEPPETPLEDDPSERVGGVPQDVLDVFAGTDESGEYVSDIVPTPDGFTVYVRTAEELAVLAGGEHKEFLAKITIVSISELTDVNLDFAKNLPGLKRLNLSLVEVSEEELKKVPKGVEVIGVGEEVFIETVESEGRYFEEFLEGARAAVSEHELSDTIKNLSVTTSNEDPDYEKLYARLGIFDEALGEVAGGNSDLVGLLPPFQLVIYGWQAEKKPFAVRPAGEITTRTHDVDYNVCISLGDDKEEMKQTLLEAFEALYALYDPEAAAAEIPATEELSEDQEIIDPLYRLNIPGYTLIQVSDFEESGTADDLRALTDTQLTDLQNSLAEHLDLYKHLRADTGDLGEAFYAMPDGRIAFRRNWRFTDNKIEVDLSRSGVSSEQYAEILSRIWQLTMVRHHVPEAKRSLEDDVHNPQSAELMLRDFREKLERDQLPYPRGFFLFEDSEGVHNLADSYDEIDLYRHRIYGAFQMLGNPEHKFGLNDEEKELLKKKRIVLSTGSGLENVGSHEEGTFIATSKVIKIDYDSTPLDIARTIKKAMEVLVRADNLFDSTFERFKEVEPRDLREATFYTWPFYVDEEGVLRFDKGGGKKVDTEGLVLWEVKLLRDQLNKKWEIREQGVSAERINNIDFSNPDGLIFNSNLFVDNENPLVSVVFNNILEIQGDYQNSFNNSWPPKLREVERSVAITDTDIENLPDDLWIGGNLFIRDTKIISLPKDLYVGGDLYCDEELEVPENIVAGKIIRG